MVKIKFITLPFIKGLKHNLEHSPQFIQVILGPRQVGKTTSLIHYLKNDYKGEYHYASVDQVFNASAGWLKEQWQLARQKNCLLVIDEIQKIENWSEAVKILWDENKLIGIKMPCVLLGSSSLDIHKGLTESLTGRFQMIRAHHWNFHESQEAYGLSFEQFLKFGGYPASYELIHDSSWEEYLKKSILESVIEKDILKNHNVKSPSLFKQAFEILISYPAQEISYTKLLGQLQDKGNTELIKYYIRLYEGAYLIKSLEKFSTNKIKTRTSSPKILLGCPAFYYLNILDDYDSAEKGRVLETLVGNQLLRTNLEVYYWRERNAEVDFVAKRGRNLWGIEVKSGRKKSTKGLDLFCQNFSNAKAVIITLENYLEFEKSPLDFLRSIK